MRVISSQLFKSKLSKTPTHQSNSLLEIAESHCFLHEYITIDNFFITDNQAMREWTRFQRWLKRQSFHSWMIWLSRASQHSDESMRCLVFFFFTSSLSFNYTSMRKSEDSKGVVETAQIHREAWFVRSATRITSSFCICWGKLSLLLFFFKLVFFCSMLFEDFSLGLWELCNPGACEGWINWRKPQCCRQSRLFLLLSFLLYLWELTF